MFKSITAIGLCALSIEAHSQLYIDDVYITQGYTDSSEYMQNCNKNEVAMFVREGMPRRAIELICSAGNNPNEQELNETPCCCTTLLESKRDTSVNSKSNKWDVLGQDNRITKVSECGNTLYKGFYIRERSFCSNTQRCVGR